MELVADILRHKGGRVVTISGDATVFQAIERMVAENVGSIIVLDDSQIEGVFTERDYLRRVALKGRTSKETPIRDVMTTDVMYVDSSYTVKQCLAIMTQKKIRHLPVMDDGTLVGVVSIGDCVKELSAGAEANVRYLTEFITGRYPG
ncbi:MAG: CBS domain-containing protein [Bacteroidota bacterium]